MSNESYIVKITKKIERKEGNSGSIKFTLPNTIPIGSKDLLFQVRDRRDNLIFEKKSTDSGITVNGQEVLIIILADDLVGKVGNDYWYELLLYNTTDYSTIAEGCFIVKQRRTRDE